MTTEITTPDGPVKAQTPVVLSASRSTDIPAYYAKWFMNRLREGWCARINPFNQRPVYISFRDVKVVVFWTKNPAPLLPYLDELDARGIHYYFQYTLNDYEREGFEPNVPAVDKRVETFRKLSERIGPDRVVWRFDPIILTPELSAGDILMRIWTVGKKLRGLTSKLVVSFVDVSVYRKVQLNLVRDTPFFTKENVISAEPTASQREEICEGLRKIRERWASEGWNRCLSILFSVFLSKRASFEGRRPSALRAFTPSLAAEKARENAPMTACGRHGVHPPLAEAIPRALIRQGLSRHILGASRLRYSTVP